MNIRRLLDIAVLRARSLFVKDGVELELERELRFHFDRQVQENIAAGMSPKDARRAAVRSMGDMPRVQEECRDMRRTAQLETTWNDLRYAVRALGRTPGFSLIVVLTLALSIGANSAIFSVIQGVLLRPLPFAEPDQLVRVYFKSETQPKFPLNPNDFRDFRTLNHSFESMAAITRHDMQLSGIGEPVRLHSFGVTAGYFRMLGFRPARGREFTSDDELAERGRLTILSDHLWRTRFQADPNILGRKLILDARPFTVIGVMPPGAQHPGNNFHAVADGDTVDLWFPFTFSDSKDRGSHYMDGIGRLKRGVSPQQANADLNATLSRLKSEYPNEQGWQVYLIPLYEETVGRSKAMLLVLLGAVGVLLLIACVNAANLLLARSSARVREIAVRSALGAARGRIVRQLLTESMVIALAGAALGTVLALGGVHLLTSFLPEGFPRAAEIRLDAGVFVFTLVIAVLSGLMFGVVPALAASRADLQVGLREGGRSSTGGAGSVRLRNMLVIGETGLACVLLIAAGLLLHSFVNLLRADPGFRPRSVLTASILLPYERYGNNAQGVRFFEKLTASLESLPGVQAAGAGTDLPWTGYDGNADGFLVEGRPAGYQTTARYHAATPDYFRALGIPLLRGRFFSARDSVDAPVVIVINESMAKRYWPGEDALGKRISFRGQPAEKDWFRVVGIVGDIRDQPDKSTVRPGLWFPHSQEPDLGMWVAVRSTSEPDLAAAQLRAVVRRLDPTLAIADVRFLDRVVGDSISTQRFALFLVGLFATLALVLAASGIYGVISYSVNQRMREFGMRMALGARPWDLTLLIVGQGVRLTAAGVVIGLLAATALGRFLETLLYATHGFDPATFSAVAIMAVVTALIACYVPARRATQADPMSSLGSD